MYIFISAVSDVYEFHGYYDGEMSGVDEYQENE